jgi:hypothetical protein
MGWELIEKRIAELEAALEKGEKLYPEFSTVDYMADANHYHQLCNEFAGQLEQLLPKIRLFMLPESADQARTRLGQMIKEYRANE